MGPDSETSLILGQGTNSQMHANLIFSYQFTSISDEQGELVTSSTKTLEDSSLGI